MFMCFCFFHVLEHPDPVELVFSRFGPREARMGKKYGRKDGFWAHRGNGRKMAEKWEKMLKNGVKNGGFDRFAQNLFFGHFFPFRARGPKWGLYQPHGITTLEHPPHSIFKTVSSATAKQGQQLGHLLSSV